jgi:hypothetical protein
LRDAMKLIATPAAQLTGLPFRALQSSRNGRVRMGQHFSEDRLRALLVEGDDAIHEAPKSFQSSISKEEVRISLKKYRKIPRMRHGSKPKNNDHEI